MEKTTIIACATATPSAIAIIRISGQGSLSLIKKVFITDRQIEERKVILGSIKTPTVSDKAQIVYYKAPNSYTGEDMAEIYTHGSPILIKEILKYLTSQKDVKLADKGEFSLRAFLNNKIDLTKAEAIVNLINSTTLLQANNSFKLLEGKLNQRINEFQDKIKKLLAFIEVDLDYPEEDLEKQTNEQLKISIKELIKDINDLKETYSIGKYVFNGVRVALVGDVNVGKSSLLNALLNKERAIVTDIEGTTTDIIEDSYEYKDYKFILSDTAGIRESSNKIEQIGIEKTKKEIDKADIILAVYESGKSFNINLSNKQNIIFVENKIDKNDSNSSNIKVSALKNINIDKLKEEIYLKAKLNLTDNNEFLLTDLRHFNCLNSALECLNSALNNINIVQNDCISFDLFSAFNHIGEITGVFGSQEIINEIFSSFCVGK